VEPAPQVIVLTVGAAEEGAEIVKFHPAQRLRRATGANAGAIVGRDPVNLGGIELVDVLAAEQRQGNRVVERKAQIGQQDPASQLAGQGLQRLDQDRIDLRIKHRQCAAFRHGGKHRARIVEHLARRGGKVLP